MRITSLGSGRAYMAKTTAEFYTNLKRLAVVEGR
jgi:hypothetical protein